MSDQDFILAPPTVSVDFSLAPAGNNFTSMMLLNQVEFLSGFAEWVEETYEALSPDRRLVNRMIFHVFYHGVMGEDEAESFPALIAKVAAQDPGETRDRIIDTLCGKLKIEDVNTFLADESSFLDAVGEAMAPEKNEKPEHHFDPEPFAAAYPLLNDPPAMLDVIVEHLQYMWDQHLEDEWQRNLPMLQESIAAFEQLDYSGMTAVEAARVVTGRDLTGLWDSKLDRAQKVTFVPSPHIGPYTTIHPREDGFHLFYGARVPEGVKSKSPAMSRSEMLVRLNALADDTRLKILELLTQQEELCAQDIINELQLSQSSASRHLRQLTATGYLVERRREVAKCYSLNRERMEDTLNALKMFLKK